MKWLYWIRKSFWKENTCKRICYFCTSYKECKSRQKKIYSLKTIDTSNNVVSLYMVHNKKITHVRSSQLAGVRRIRKREQQDEKRDVRIVLWVHRDAFYDVINFFGNYVMMFEGSDGHYIAHLEEPVNDKLISFIISKGNKLRIIEPEFAVVKVIRMLEEARKMYSA